MMKINIEAIPHHEQRYPTVGDYWLDENGVEQVRVSAMPDWRYEVLIAMHELLEWVITKHRNIAEEAISDFDIRFENSRNEGLAIGEPGDHPHAPYRKEHFFATNIERLLAAELDVDWHEYDRYVDGIAIKK